MVYKTQHWLQLGILILVPALLLFSVPTVTIAQINVSSGTQDAVKWKLDTTHSGVGFYYSIVKCGDSKLVLLKLNNTNTKTVKVFWKETFYTTQSGTTGEGPFQEKQMVLPPGTTAATSCETVTQADLVTRPRQTTPVYKAEVTGFKFKDIRIVKKVN